MKTSIKETYRVKRITSDKCKDWLLKKHYAKRMCSISYSFGLYDKNNLIGIVTYGMPPSPTLSSSICGDEFKSIVLELNRLVVNEGLERNVLSYFVSQSLTLLPKPSIIVSFSDLNMGHNGYIYQACNFIYTGLSSNTSKLIDKFGNEFHFRNIGHYQKNNRLNVSLVKRRDNEDKIDKIEIAKYIKSNLNGYKIKDLDAIFGYKDTCSHWIRMDKGFSFPSVEDWTKLKDVLNFDDKYDDLMTSYKLVPDPNEIVKKLELKKVEIKPKHRYIYFCASSKMKKRLTEKLRLNILSYPKGENKRYDASYLPNIQTELF
jgi:hypothetical protein